MRISSSLVVPSTIAIVSTVLLCAPGVIANPERIRRHASPHHGRCAETGGKTARVGPGCKHNGAAPDCANHANGNRGHAVLCAGLANGEDCQPGESRQQL